VSPELAWNDLVTTAVLGTDRRSVEVAALPGSVGSAAGRLTGDPAETLLGAAALMLARDRAAAMPRRAVAAPDALPAEELRAMGPAAEAAFTDALQEPMHDLLLEALALAARAGLAAPRRCLPRLLERAVASKELRPLILAVLGVRGRWLAAQNPNWTTLVAEASAADHEGQAGHQGTGEPHAVPSAEDWAALSGPRRLATLRAIGSAPDAGLEALLERALDDPRADVRDRARTLLARLPESAYVGRMTARADLLVHVRRRLLRTEVSLADVDRLDQFAGRDGIDDQHANPPSRAARARIERWAVRALEITPLRHWDERLGGPEAALGATRAEDRDVLARGWLRAASTQENQSWLLALARIAPIRELAIVSGSVRRPWPGELTSVILTRVTSEVHRAAQAPDAQRKLVVVPLNALIDSLASNASATPGPASSRLTEALLGLANAATPASPAGNAAAGGGPLPSDLERALRTAHDHLSQRVRLNREIS
jgi:hypothetical protein